MDTVRPKNDEFEPTSTHPSWQGKIKCLHCNHIGWPMGPSYYALWWGHKHGIYCKNREVKYEPPL